MSSPAPPGVTKSPEAAAGLLWRVFIVLAPFALGYYLSTLVRSINAVIAPALTGEIGLTPGQLGLLTATYFVCFALFQLPLGVLLDRFGPRRVQSALLLVAALGTVIFALGRDVIVLTIGRGLIGVGMAGALMASITAIDAI
ncbi:MAG: MFS transporter, partial [Alphaproteobacteria bacterium]|nr:MFS transporter [Alphaproteobacteria bacterium]